jgi:hypothetical protein
VPKSGDIAYVFHYSKKEPLKCTVLERPDQNTLKILPDKKTDLVSYSLFDPLVICLSAHENVRTFGGDIQNIDFKNNKIEIKANLDDTAWNSQRQYERYPASLYADIRINSISKDCRTLRAVVS